MLAFYKKVLALRHANRSLLAGSYIPINEDDSNVLSYLRVYKSDGMVVALNMTNTPQKVKLQFDRGGFGSTKILIGSGRSAVSGTEVSLEPYGVFIGQLGK